MLIKTILNKCHKFKSFVYVDAYFSNFQGESVIEVTIKPRKNSSVICSICNRPAPCYDTGKKARRFEFVPFWGFLVFFLYYMQFLAHWSKKLSWKDVAINFRTSWGKVFRAVGYIVDWGLEHRDLSGIESIGVDEVLWHKGHKYLTLVYQINSENVRLLWIGKDRTVKTLLRFFRFLGKDRSKGLSYICSDMWKPYLKVIKKKASHAIRQILTKP